MCHAGADLGGGEGGGGVQGVRIPPFQYEESHMHSVIYAAFCMLTVLGFVRLHFVLPKRGSISMQLNPPTCVLTKYLIARSIEWCV